MDNLGLHSNWKALSTVHIPYKIFVPQGSQTQRDKEKDEPQPEKHKISSLEGSDIAEFYREVIQTPSSSKSLKDESRRELSKPAKQKSTKIIFCKNLYFRAAMNNDVAVLENIDYKNDDLNSRDGFQWTAPMMAICEGAFQALQCLHRLGANFHLCDSHGNTVFSLARKKGYEDVVHGILKAVPKPSVPATPKKFETSYCDICNSKFVEASRRTHETSTAHLFNCKSQIRKINRYNISSSNRGLKLMVKQGWDKESGLGPNQNGNLYPVKTVIRKQRTGIGIKQDDPKVTHFKPYDLAAVKYRPPPLAGRSRKQLRQDQNRDKRKERIFRRELS